MHILKLWVLHQVVTDVNIRITVDFGTFTTWAKFRWRKDVTGWQPECECEYCRNIEAG